MKSHRSYPIHPGIWGGEASPHSQGLGGGEASGIRLGTGGGGVKKQVTSVGVWGLVEKQVTFWRYMGDAEYVVCWERSAEYKLVAILGYGARVPKTPIPNVQAQPQACGQQWEQALGPVGPGPWGWALGTPRWHMISIHVHTYLCMCIPCISMYMHASSCEV